MEKGDLKNLYNILIFLSFLQSVIGFILISSTTMKFREPIKARITAGLIVMIIEISLLSYLVYSIGRDSIDRFAILVILVIQLSWFLICSNDRFFVSLFSFLSFVNIYLSISYISDTISFNYSGSAFVISRILIRTLIYVVIIPFLYKIVRPHFRRLVENLDKEWRGLVLVPLMFLITQIIVIYYPNPYWYRAIDDWSRYIIIAVYILFLAVYYILSVQSSAIVKKYALEKNQLLIAQQEKLWESELIRQKAETLFFNRQRHDMQHHNSVIISLIKSGDIDSLKDYMTSYDLAINEYQLNSYSLNPIINSIINLYAGRAEGKNIKTEFRVNVPENINIDNIDITCVLCNTLENAFEGCLRLPDNVDKEILTTIKYLDNRLRINVINTCDSEIDFEGEIPVTKKIGGGTGIKSILYTAEHYDGTAGFSIQNGKFITQIVLNSR